MLRYIIISIARLTYAYIIYYRTFVIVCVLKLTYSVECQPMLALANESRWGVCFYCMTVQFGTL